MTPLIFLFFGVWYGYIIPPFWPLVAVLVGSGTLGMFRVWVSSHRDTGIIFGLTELVGRYCWVPFSFGAIAGVIVQVFR